MSFLSHTLRASALAICATLSFAASPQDGVLVFGDETQPQTPRSPGAPTQNSAQAMQIPPLPYVAHIPGAATMGPPAWVKPGMRISFSEGDASTPARTTMKVLIEDPQGSLVDADGKRYRRGSMPTASGSGGLGLIHIDVTYMETGVAAIDMRQYLGDGSQQVPAPVAPVSGELLNAGSNMYWINPALLAQVRPGRHGSFEIMTGQWQVPGLPAFDAVVFTERTATANAHLVYDKVSGVRISRGSTMQRNGKNGPETGVSESYLKGTRALKLPWAEATLPNCPEVLKQASFAGQMRIEPNMGGGGTPMQDRVKFEGEVPGCFITSFSRTSQGFQGVDARLRCTAVNQIGGLVMSPASLAKLTQGQTIDQDPLTRVRTFVEFKGRADNGQQMVIITEEGPGGVVRWAYEAQTGALGGYVEGQYMPDGQSGMFNYFERG